MYYKLVNVTEFDALEGSMSYSTKQLVAVCAANNTDEAKRIFSFLDRARIIKTSYNQEIEEATKEEFDDFIGE